MKMRNCALAACWLVFGLTLSAAQEKISSQWKCDAKPADSHNIAVPDHEGHSYSVGQRKCTSEKGSMGDAKEQEGTYTEFADMAGGEHQNRDVFAVTLSSAH